MSLLKNLLFTFLIVISFSSCTKESLSEPSSKTTISVVLNGNNSQYDELWIEVTNVLVKVIDDESIPDCWLSLKTTDNPINHLIDISKTSNLNLVRGLNIPEGTIYEIRLVIGNNNTVVIDGKPINLTTNSVYQNGLVSRVNKHLDSNTHYQYNLEFDTSNSVLETQVEGYYILEPSIHTTLDIL